MDYDEMYRKNPDLWKKEPSKILTLALQEINEPGKFLDLGCGQGKDSIFMSNLGFESVAIDSSIIAINRLNEVIAENKFPRIKTFVDDIANFHIDTDTYDVIACIDTLPFLEKDTGPRIIETIKGGTKKGGLIILTAFTTLDPSYCIPKNKKLFVTYFEINEMLGLFHDFHIIHYFEGCVRFEKAIKNENQCHNVVRIIARK